LNGKRIIIAALLLSQALDLFTTFVGFNLGLREGNVLPSLFLSLGGNVGLALFKLIAVTCLITIIALWGSKYPRAWRGVVLATGVTFAAVAMNTVSIAMAAGN
jgi:hypothetical protein